MINKDLRYERKMYYPHSTKYELSTLLKLHPYGFKEIFYERRVNSIYFDTPDFCSFKDNADGNPNRAKIRIRWYGNKSTCSNKDTLEIKTKTGLVGFKLASNIQSISDTVPGVNLNDLNSVLKVSYNRIYFSSLDNKYRFTIDSDIAYSLPDSNITYYDPGFVLELKYNVKDDKTADYITKFLPERINKFSKYARGILYLYG